MLFNIGQTKMKDGKCASYQTVGGTHVRSEDYLIGHLSVSCLCVICALFSFFESSLHRCRITG